MIEEENINQFYLCFCSFLSTILDRAKTNVKLEKIETSAPYAQLQLSTS